MDLEQVFVDAGGNFLNSFAAFTVKASRIKAILFDWDGVFNNGAKGEDLSSPFTEIDSMGLNMLRLSFWLGNNKIPYLGIITGQNNKSAIQLATREHFHALYAGFLNKELAFNHLLEKNELLAEEVAYAYDDILDLAIADLCGLRMQVRNQGSPLFDQFIIENGLADYMTANSGSNFAVREVCELLIGVLGNYNETVKERAAFGKEYKEYIAERNAIKTDFFGIDMQGNIINNP